MLILEPIFHKAIWGGNSLVPIYGEAAQGLAHLYSVWCKPDCSNRILNGSNKDRRLYEVFNFKLTIALVDAAQDLSIQVHPSDDIARRIENNEIGKREAWYFIKKPSTGYIYNGMSQGVDLSGDILSGVQKLVIDDEDYVFVSPGTVHAMTAGSFVYEIEEGSDLTYRIFDYNRIDLGGNKRELHLDKAKSSIEFNKKSSIKKYDNNEIIEAKFATALYKESKSYTNRNEESIALTFINETTFEIDDLPIKMGMSIILFPEEEVKFSPFKANFIVARLTL